VVLANEDVFMATQFGEFVRTMIVFSRGGGGKKLQGRSSAFLAPLAPPQNTQK
jgi:hypothetical protein